MNIYLLCTEADNSYLSYLKPMLIGHKVRLTKATPSTLAELRTKLIVDKFDAVLVSNPKVLGLLVKGTPGVALTLDDYSGSMFHLADKPIVILNPIAHLVTTKTAKFLFTRYISKITRPEVWFPQTKFTWEVATLDSLPDLYRSFENCILLAIDIETPRGIAPFPYCVGYCGVWLSDSGEIQTHCIVIPTLTEEDWVWVAKFNNLPMGKVMQNGSYDCSYFLRYNATPVNYLWDTQHLQHSWYSELPKRLDFIASFALRDVRFWKDDGKSGNLIDKYEYNARDVWATANGMLAVVREMPKWALRNYVEEFPVVFPCLLMSMEGFAVDTTQQAIMAKDQAAIKQTELKKLELLVDTPNFNPGSSKQKLQLFGVLGCKDITSADKKNLEKISTRHPVIGRITAAILLYQKAAKLLSTYINIALLDNRWMYAFSVAGTETGRLASKKSHFWCGTQIQNAPPYAKKMAVADAGYELAERDYSQSEARCVGYLAEDLKLIKCVESDFDYHGLNAQNFFGIPYAEIVKTTITEYDEFDSEGTFLKHVREVIHDTINKPIRDLSKRTNHGANYNMGEHVMLETMGEANVYKAKLLLKLPAYLSLKQVCGELLARYAATYPKVKQDYYQKVIFNIITYHKLVSPLGWTRYFFGDPKTNKRDLNVAVAHSPQNLSVAIINRCLLKIFYWQLSEDNWCTKVGKAKLRLKAQVHDSVVYQYLPDHVTEVNAKVAELMSHPVNVNGRRMFIPSDLKFGKTCWGGLK